MSDYRVPPRDLVAGILYFAAIVISIVAFDPFRPTLLLAALGIGIVAYFVASHKFVTLGAAFWVLAFRFLVVVLFDAGWLALAGGVASAAVGYTIYKLDPESRERIG